MKQEIIKLKNLCYEYQQERSEGKRVLQFINKVIREGEYLSVIGGNGSGKTTLAKHLNGLLVPSDGSVLVYDLNTKDKKNLPAIRQYVGMVFQNPENQIVAAVVEEDVAFGPENLGLEPSEIRHRVSEVLEVVQLTRYRQFPPEYLSGGEKQRLAIAGALAMQPKCLVLDEATSMLDETGRRQIMQILRRLNKELGVTIVQITHNMEEAVLADQVWVLKDGRIYLDSAAQDIWSYKDELYECGLELPAMSEIAWGLKDAGFELPEGLHSVGDMVQYLCQL